ncbi:hypothetical protein HK097_000288 [Rhizophlyctis rosea]|uniref:Uncharacterized protein n=1 Tax=Rhizophlyctis rosea TaxID=64517 RepID=A0AAD5S6Y2_9FUNG|nr:hypothetical protein HK097_000288 [Rhizophlyctis rosea]
MYEELLSSQWFEAAAKEVQDTWIEGIVESSGWGVVVRQEAGLAGNAGAEETRAALMDGRIRLKFTVIEFLRYDFDLAAKLSAVPAEPSKKQKDDLKRPGARDGNKSSGGSNVSGDEEYLYDGGAKVAARALGIYKPHPRNARNGARKPDDAWLSVGEAMDYMKQVRKAEPVCHFEGRAYQEDPDRQKNKNVLLGTYSAAFEIGRWEDRTEEEDIQELLEVLENGPLGKAEIDGLHQRDLTLESDTLIQQFRSIKTNFVQGYQSLIRI